MVSVSCNNNVVLAGRAVQMWSTGLVSSLLASVVHKQKVWCVPGGYVFVTADFVVVIDSITKCAEPKKLIASYRMMQDGCHFLVCTHPRRY